MADLAAPQAPLLSPTAAGPPAAAAAASGAVVPFMCEVEVWVRKEDDGATDALRFVLPHDACIADLLLACAPCFAFAEAGGGAVAASRLQLIRDRRALSNRRRVHTVAGRGALVLRPKPQPSLWSHAIRPCDLRPGDHVYTLSGLGLFQHHGIAVASNEDDEVDGVVHLTKTHGLVQTSLGHFLQEECTITTRNDCIIGAPQGIMRSGKFQYEVVFEEGYRNCMLGWANPPDDSDCFSGEVISSCAADYKDMDLGAVFWFVPGVQNADVVGVCADLDSGTIQFAKNGEWDSGQIVDINGMNIPHGLFPVVRTRSSKLRMNFGSKPFKFPAPESNVTEYSHYQCDAADDAQRISTLSGSDVVLVSGDADDFTLHSSDAVCLRRAEHDDQDWTYWFKRSGVSYRDPVLQQQETCRRARELVASGTFYGRRGYDLIGNGEAVARYCKTGKPLSAQALRALRVSQVLMQQVVTNGAKIAVKVSAKQVVVSAAAAGAAGSATAVGSVAAGLSAGSVIGVSAGCGVVVGAGQILGAVWQLRNDATYTADHFKRDVGGIIVERGVACGALLAFHLLLFTNPVGWGVWAGSIIGSSILGLGSRQFYDALHGDTREQRLNPYAIAGVEEHASIADKRQAIRRLKRQMQADESLRSMAMGIADADPNPESTLQSIMRWITSAPTDHERLLMLLEALHTLESDVKDASNLSDGAAGAAAGDPEATPVMRLLWREIDTIPREDEGLSDRSLDDDAEELPIEAPLSHTNPITFHPQVCF